MEPPIPVNQPAPDPGFQQQPQPNVAPVLPPPPKSGSNMKTILAIAILVLLALGCGYLFYQNTVLKETVSANEREMSVLESQNKALQTEIDEAASSDVLKMTEFGVQFTKPDAVASPMYFITKNPQGNDVAFFSSPGIQKLAAENPSNPSVKNACGLNDAPLGTLTKVAAGTLIDNVKVEEVKETETLYVKKINEDYFVYRSPVGQCSTVEKVQVAQKTQSAALLSAIKNMQVISTTPVEDDTTPAEVQ